MRSGAYDAMPALHRFLAGYPRGPSLELGAGAGDFAALVAAARPDPAPYVCLEEYRPELRKARARGLACVSAHPTRPPFAGGFATVFLANILHHSVDPGALLAASRPLLL